ncbi:MAG TPA: dolichyl-phosphate beta-glucosyltransferase [Bryobacteraceae bacterium]|nr:dolichyl-phosphate beta-glucosyltransferase [Bryobacteraceae bacterium]
MPSLSIIIPAYNEEKRLPATLDRILAYLGRREWSFAEVLVVDDGSTDGTAALVGNCRPATVSLRLLSNPGNRGKGYAVRHGMMEAKGEWRLLTDSDLSCPVEEFDKLLLAAAENAAQISIGSRALDPSLISVHQPLGRELSGRMFNVIMRLMTGLPFRDTQCGFKLYHASAAAQIFPRQTLDGFGFDVEDLFIAKIRGIPAVEVPVRWANVEGTRVGMLSGLRAFWDLVTIRKNQALGRYR